MFGFGRMTHTLCGLFCWILSTVKLLWPLGFHCNSSDTETASFDIAEAYARRGSALRSNCGRKYHKGFLIGVEDLDHRVMVEPSSSFDLFFRVELVSSLIRKKDDLRGSIVS